MAQVDASSELRKTENIFYPPTLWIVAQLTTEEAAAPTTLPAAQPINATATSLEPTKEAEVEHSNPPPVANT